MEAPQGASELGSWYVIRNSPPSAFTASLAPAGGAVSNRL